MQLLKYTGSDTSLQGYKTIIGNTVIVKPLSKNINQFIVKIKETDLFLTAFFNHLFTEDVKIVLHSGNIGIPGSKYKFEGKEANPENLITLLKLETTETQLETDNEMYNSLSGKILCRVRYKRKTYIFETSLNTLNIYTRNNKCQSCLANVKYVSMFFSIMFFVFGISTFFSGILIGEELLVPLLVGGLLMLFLMVVLAVIFLMDLPLFSSNLSEEQGRLDRDIKDYFEKPDEDKMEDAL